MTQGTVQVRLDDLPDELRSLDQWLRSEGKLRGRVRLTHHPIRPGDMGGALDAVAIAISSGGAATVFVTSLFTWLSQRRKDTSVRLRLTRPDGHEAALVLTGVHDPETVVDKVLEFFRINE